jgi:hypothetical protein
MAKEDIAQIAALRAPILCFDTCAVLDLLRDPTRAAVKAHERQAALDLLTIIEDSERLVALMAEQVDREFKDNVKSVEDEANQALQGFTAQVRRIDQVAAVYGASGLTSLDHLDDLVVRARRVADRWVEVAILARQGLDIPARAFRRMTEVRTPARRGKDSMKDCVVVETYLDFATRLRSAGLSEPIVFISSNTRDYAGDTGTKLNADLAHEFADLNLEYAPNFAAAKHLLGL